MANEAWGMAANRIYYACFHAMTALLVNDGHPVSTHLGMKISFGKYYVQTGVATPQQGRLFSQFDELFRIDLDEMYVAYWAGLLGKPTKHRPVGYQESNYNDSETHEELFEWEFDSTNKPLRLKTSDEIFIF